MQPEEAKEIMERVKRTLDEGWRVLKDIVKESSTARLLAENEPLGELVTYTLQNDQHGELQDKPLPREALHLADLGFFDLQRLGKLARKGAFWLTHVQARTRVYDSQGQRWHLAALMAKQTTPTVEMSVTLGSRERLPCRLLAQRVPAAVAEQRRERLRDRARRANKQVSAERLALADWTLFVTNVPERCSRLNLFHSLTVLSACPEATNLPSGRQRALAIEDSDGAD